MARWFIIGLLLVTGVSALGQEGTATQIGDQLLSFIQSSAELLGKGLVHLINLILPEGRGVSPELVQPIGYLALITIILLVFGIIAAARKVIWIIVVVGWVLLVVRIILDALRVV